jgi:hypothetical protein
MAEISLARSARGPAKDLAKILINLFPDLPDLFAFFLVKFTHFEVVDRL